MKQINKMKQFNMISRTINKIKCKNYNKIKFKQKQRRKENSSEKLELVAKSKGLLIVKSQ
jgi:hypothetical protein